MFNMYRRRFYRGARGGGGMDGSSEELGHDRFNYMNPNVNYDKWPRRLRPKKNSIKIEMEAPESPHLTEDKSFSGECSGGGSSGLMGGSGGAGPAATEGASASCQRDCKGSLREHQRLLNLRSSRHKCSPRCRVKVNIR